MQTPYQCFGRSFDVYSGPDVMMVGTHGHNAYESSMAPHPFRVNSEGNACAILAGPDHVEHHERLGGPVPPRVGGLRG